jgi:hypothetical protein
MNSTSSQNYSIPLEKVLAAANGQAAARGSAKVGPEHIFAAFMSSDPSSSNGLQLLVDLGMDVTAVSTPLRESGISSGSATWPPSPTASSKWPQSPLSDGSSKLLDKANGIADGLGNSRIGTEHLLLAFLSNPLVQPAQSLAEIGITGQRVRSAICSQQLTETYKREAGQDGVGGAASSVFGGAKGSRLQKVYLLFLIIYFVIALSSAISVSFGYEEAFHWVNDYVHAMGMPMCFFIFGLSMAYSYLSLFWQTRAAERKSIISQAQWSGELRSKLIVAQIFGAVLVCATLMVIGNEYSVSSALSRPVRDYPALVMTYVITVNCVAISITHWLMTINIRRGQI